MSASPRLTRAARLLVHPLLRGWFRLRCGSGELLRTAPARPLIVAANHRSVLDPMVIGVLLGRPAHYLAKQELFRGPVSSRLLVALGAIPVDRGGDNAKALAAATAVLDRGDCLVIFPEGRCMPPGPLGKPRSGVGRLALLTGATVLPVAITGTEATNTRRLRPAPIQVEAAAPLHFHPAENEIDPRDSRAATEQIWAAVRTAHSAATRSGAGEQPRIGGK
jgi:1-acyl-sn-glycerol-3-phosphate acyltransferase